MKTSTATKTVKAIVSTKTRPVAHACPVCSSASSPASSNPAYVAVRKCTNRKCRLLF